MRKVALCALGLLPVAFGCTALLGNFDVASGPGTDGGGADGADDGASADGTSDGPSDGGDQDVADAAGTIFTTCGIDTPRIVAQYAPDAGGFDFGSLVVFRTAMNQVRVVTQRNLMDGATVYSFDPKKNGQNGPITPDILDLQAAGKYFDARNLPVQGNLSLLFMERTGGGQVQMKVMELAHASPTQANPVYVSEKFTDTASGGGNGNFEGLLGAYQNNNEYFWAVGNWPSPPGGTQTYNLIVGHRVNAASKPTPVVVHTTPDQRLTRVREMARSKTTQFIFNDEGPDNQNEPGTSYFAVPQDTATTVVPKTIKPAGATNPYVMIGASGVATGDGIRVAVAEVDFNNPNSFGVVKAGLVAQADLDQGFDGTKIPNAFTISSLTEVPSEGAARFFAEDLLWLGTPPEPLRGKGLNFIWFNTQTRAMRAKIVGANRLLLDHMQITRTSIALVQQTAVQAELDVVLIETLPNGNSALTYATMSCIK